MKNLRWALPSGAISKSRYSLVLFSTETETTKMERESRKTETDTEAKPQTCPGDPGVWVTVFESDVRGVIPLGPARHPKATTKDRQLYWWDGRIRTVLPCAVRQQNGTGAE